MTLLNTAQGAPIAWMIGQRGQEPDIHPGRLIRIEHGLSDRGQEGLIAIGVYQLTNLQGEKYFAVRRILEQYTDDRDWLVSELDGTSDQPKALSTIMGELAAQRKDFLTRGPNPLVIGEPDAVEVTEESTPEPVAATASRGKAKKDDLPF